MLITCNPIMHTATVEFDDFEATTNFLKKYEESMSQRLAKLGSNPDLLSLTIAQNGNHVFFRVEQPARLMSLSIVSVLRLIWDENVDLYPERSQNPKQKREEEFQDYANLAHEQVGVSGFLHDSALKQYSGSPLSVVLTTREDYDFSAGETHEEKSHETQGSVAFIEQLTQENADLKDKLYVLEQERNKLQQEITTLKTSNLALRATPEQKVEATKTIQRFFRNHLAQKNMADLNTGFISDLIQIVTKRKQIVLAKQLMDQLASGQFAALDLEGARQAFETVKSNPTQLADFIKKVGALEFNKHSESLNSEVQFRAAYF